MTVTENDIKTNAASIAALINAATAKTINDLTSETSITNTDFLHFYDVSASADKKILFSNLLSGLYFPMIIPAGAWDFPQANPVPLDDISGTNEEILGHPFDNVVNESMRKTIVAPYNINTSGSIIIYILCHAEGASPSGEVLWVFKHDKATPGADSWDGPFTSEAFSSFTDIDTQKRIEIASKTIAVSSLGWSALDLIRCKIERNATGETSGLSQDAIIDSVLIMWPIVKI